MKAWSLRRCGSCRQSSDNQLSLLTHALRVKMWRSLAPVLRARGQGHPMHPSTWHLLLAYLALLCLAPRAAYGQAGAQAFQRGEEFYRQDKLLEAEKHYRV